MLRKKKEHDQFGGEMTDGSVIFRSQYLAYRFRLRLVHRVPCRLALSMNPDLSKAGSKGHEL